MSEEDVFFKTRDGIKLHLNIGRYGHEKWLIGTHGIGEYLERHHYLRELLGDHYNIALYDLRGHGLSGGREAYVKNFNDFTEDLDDILSFLKETYGLCNYSLFGHSMGALITGRYLQVKASPHFYPQRVYLNAPPVGLSGLGGQLFSLTPSFLLKGLAKIPQSIRLSGIVDLNTLSHNKEVKKSYIQDPKIKHSLHTKLIFEMLKCSQQTFSVPLAPRCPCTVSIGSEDRIVSYTQLVSYFQIVEKDTDLKIFEGAYHEIHNEIEKYRGPYLEYLRNYMTLEQ